MKQKIFLLSLIFCNAAFALPKDFVYLKDIDPSIQQDIRYFTNNNFVGKRIDGYESGQCILTREAAVALSKVQAELKKQSLGLKVYDCYRPQMAVDEFVRWSQDFSDQKMKKEYYPNVNKEDVFKLGYVASKSGHTRGSTVDLTVVSLEHKKLIELPMGTHFDFLDAASHPFAMSKYTIASHNRLLLRDAMMAGGFKPLSTEWWHFTLENEPYPDTYFNFPVK